ncbi:MAG: MFS transporter [Sharpea porci]
MKTMSQKRMIAYGMPGLATLFTFTMFTSSGLYFFTDVVGMSSVFAGIIMMIGTFWDAFTDPIVGILSDSRDPKKGRRRPFLIWSAVPFGVVTWLLFTNWGFVGIQQKVYFIIIALAFYTFQTTVDVPYTSLSGEVTADYDVRSRLATLRTFWATVGVSVGGGIMAYTSWLTPYVGKSKAWSICFAIFGVICTLSIIAGWMSSKGYENEQAVIEEKMSFKAILNGPLKNKAFLHLAVAFIFGILAQNIFLGILVYYLQNNLALTQAQISMVNIIMWIAALFWVFPIDHWSTKYSKATAWVISMSIWLITMIVFPFFFLKKGSSIMPIIMTSILVVGLNALYQVIYAMISDCVEVDELKNGVRTEGLFYSMATVSQKIASAIGISILGVLIEKIGYNAQLTTQSQATLNGFQMIFIVGTCACLAISIIAMLTNPLSKKRYQDVLKALDQKHHGEEVDFDNFHDLIILDQKK